MNNNPELNNGSAANNQADQWNILPKDNFYQFQQNSHEAPASEPSDEEIRQILIARRREQLKNNPEARSKANGVSKKLIAGALAAMTLIGSFFVVQDQARGKDILGSELARQRITELENVEKVVLHGNLRSDPETTNSQDTNIYTSLDNEVTVEIPNGDKVLLYRDEHDPNGAYYGLSTNTLENEGLIDKNNDRDETVWVNEQNVRIIHSDTPTSK